MHIHLKGYIYNFIPQAVAEMAAIGFGLQKDAFTSIMKQVNVAKIYLLLLLIPDILDQIL